MANVQQINVPVPGFEELSISKLGLILRGTDYTSPTFIANIFVTSKGYIAIHHKRKTLFVHRLMALAFIPNPENKPYINHKDGNKLNNSLSNLEWCTVTENNRHSYHVLDNNSQYPKRKVAIFKDGIFVTESISVREAAKYVKGASTNVSKCCKGERQTHNGFTFRYSDEMSKFLI